MVHCLASCGSVSGWDTWKSLNTADRLANTKTKRVSRWCTSIAKKAATTMDVRPCLYQGWVNFSRSPKNRRAKENFM